MPEAVIDEAERWLADELAGVLELPYGEQRRSPLEVFQEAMSGPTAALSAAGAKRALRDPTSVAALPGDIFAVAPASSSALGQEAFEAHLGWGVEKARALAHLVTGEGRRVVVVSGDLMDRSRFEDAINGAGLHVAGWSAEATGSETRPVAAFVDLTHPEADAMIRSLAAAGVRITAYGPHVDADAMTRARLLGADLVLPRSRLFRAIAEYLPRPA